MFFRWKLPHPVHGAWLLLPAMRSVGGLHVFDVNQSLDVCLVPFYLMSTTFQRQMNILWTKNKARLLLNQLYLLYAREYISSLAHFYIFFIIQLFSFYLMSFDGRSNVLFNHIAWWYWSTLSLLFGNYSIPWLDFIIVSIRLYILTL